MKIPKPIPPFKTVEEEANYWDTHSVAPYFKNAKRMKLVFEEDDAKDAVLHIKIDSKRKKLLEEQAKRQASTVSQLLRMWVYQKLADSLDTHRAA